MAKMTVIYNKPEDVDSFEDHYFKIHVPLAKQLPGLIRYEISEGPVMSTTGHPSPFRIANLYFESKEAMMQAFQSDIGKQCAADRRILARDEDVQIYVYDSKDL